MTTTTMTTTRTTTTTNQSTPMIERTSSKMPTEVDSRSAEKTTSHSPAKKSKMTMTTMTTMTTTGTPITVLDHEEHEIMEEEARKDENVRQKEKKVKEKTARVAVKGEEDTWVEAESEGKSKAKKFLRFALHRNSFSSSLNRKPSQNKTTHCGLEQARIET